MASTERKATVVPPPPRLTGDLAADNRAMNDWVWQFYESTVVQSGILDPNYQLTAPAFDAGNLADPSNATVSTAQQTANAAINALIAHGLYP